VNPIAQLSPPLMLEQTALDFGQGQDRWHGRILLPPMPVRNSLFLMLGFGLVIIVHDLIASCLL
jgi:hypothetical protein